ncbi:MAG: hypothetical protein ABIQ93_06635 [Saprospiraceae bacterium]
MSDKINEEWLEHEARESLVATDLSAKMKQWGGRPLGEGGGGKPRALPLFFLLLVCGAAWWFWPKAKNQAPQQQPSPVEQPAPVPVIPAPESPQQGQTVPIAQKPSGNRYLALAQSSYLAPNFSADIRGNAPLSQDALNKARQALASHRPAAALDALQQAPAEYETDADYLRAHALFEWKKFAQSAVVFGKLRESVRYGEAAQWYAILAMLPDYEHRKVAIMPALKKIATDENHTYQQEAKRLVRELELK